MRSFFSCLVVVGLLIGGLLDAAPAEAQRDTGSFGVGGQVGQPGGFTAKVYSARPWAGVLSVGTNFRDQTVLHGHVLQEHPLPESPLWVFAGPSAFLGLRSLDTRSRVVTGAGARVGLNFYRNRFEVYLHASPRFEVLPEVGLQLGTSAGLRYYFKL